MKQTKLIRLLALTLIFCLLLTNISFKPALALAAERPPNILLIVADDLADADVAYMPQVKSLLVDGGTSFSNYFVNVSLCCPSRATTLRGQYAHNTHVWTNYKDDGSFVVFHKRGEEKSTIATWLQDRGYRTAHFGKYLNIYPFTATRNYVPPGWDEWHTPVHGSAYLQFNYTLNENGKLVKYGEQPEDYGTDVYTNKAQEFITKAAKANQPFFAYLDYYAPHQPAIPAPRHLDLFPDARMPRTPAYNEADVSDKPQYIRELPLLNQQKQSKIDWLYQKRLRSLQAVDEGLVSLYRTLKATNQLDNTYIFFTSDNGFHLGQHRLPVGKETAYEEDIHLPLFIRGPQVTAGKKIEQIVGNVDLASTFADLAGAKIPDFVDGRSFASLFLSGLPTPKSWRQVFLLQHLPNLHEELIIPKYSGLRTAHCTYVEYDNGDRELYNIKQDPYQLENLAPTAKSETLDQYSQNLAQLRNCHGKNCRHLDVRPVPDCTN